MVAWWYGGMVSWWYGGMVSSQECVLRFGAALGECESHYHDLWKLGRSEQCSSGGGQAGAPRRTVTAWRSVRSLACQ